MQEENVVLVNELDHEVGVMGKLEAHQKGVLHRAFSVFLLNDDGKLLMQKRALTKYHSPGLWTNTCCSHQRVGEESDQAVKRRLMEEMGIIASFRKVYDFIYKADVGGGLTEHELDYVYIGRYNDTPVFNKDEVAEVSYMDLSELEKDIKLNPSMYTEWFKITFNDFKKYVHASVV
ncbi:MAG: isopentenyl-diphosphate Delta-isomerase [Cytophagaceae bacterium]